MPSKTKPAAPSEAAIRERAYFLWEAAGRPEGAGDHFWHLAQAEAAAPEPAKPPKAKAGAAKTSSKGKPRAESDAPKAKSRPKSAGAKSAKRATPKPRAAIQPPK